MMYSLNEIETHATRAARGAGLTWGLAEEAGKAIGWLSARNFDGAGLLASCLVRIISRSYGELMPIVDAGPWHCATGELCPLLAGIALSDRADLLGAGETITMRTVIEPTMLIPFAAWTSAAAGRPLRLQVPGSVFVVDHGQLLLPDDGLPPMTGLAENLTVTATDEPAQHQRLEPGGDGVQIRDDLWTELDLLARRTYVPESEASRLHGAGAGDIDND